MSGSLTASFAAPRTLKCVFVNGAVWLRVEPQADALRRVHYTWQIVNIHNAYKYREHLNANKLHCGHIN